MQPAWRKIIQMGLTVWTAIVCNVLQISNAEPNIVIQGLVQGFNSSKIRSKDIKNCKEKLELKSFKKYVALISSVSLGWNSWYQKLRSFWILLCWLLFMAFLRKRRWFGWVGRVYIWPIKAFLVFINFWSVHIEFNLLHIIYSRSFFISNYFYSAKFAKKWTSRNIVVRKSSLAYQPLRHTK